MEVNPKLLSPAPTHVATLVFLQLTFRCQSETFPWVCFVCLDTKKEKYSSAATVGIISKMLSDTWYNNLSLFVAKASTFTPCQHIHRQLWKQSCLRGEDIQELRFQCLCLDRQKQIFLETMTQADTDNLCLLVSKVGFGYRLIKGFISTDFSIGHHSYILFIARCFPQAFPLPPSLSFCLPFLSSITDWSILWRCRPVPDARALQQLNLHPSSVFPLPVRMWADQQQSHWCSTQGHLCGKRPPADIRCGDISLSLSVMENLNLTSLFLQPSIADVLNLAWWTSTVAWWECVYCMSNDKETLWGCPLKTILTVFRLLLVKQMPLGYFQLSVTAAVTCCLILCIHGQGLCFVL